MKWILVIFAAWAASMAAAAPADSGQEVMAPALDPSGLRRTFVYRDVDGLRLQADVYHPPGERRTPAILWLHGGALLMGMRHDVRLWELQSYLDHGYTVATIDYRLAPETRLPGIIDDVEHAWRWMRTSASELGIDSTRIAVVGHSAGAYLALLCGAVLEPSPRAIVSFYGYGTILGAWYTRPDSFFLAQPRVSDAQADSAVQSMPISSASGVARARLYVYLRQRGLWTQRVTGLDPRTDAGRLERYCPVRQVTRRYPPTILLHGTADTDVPFAESATMHDALLRANVPCELVPFAGRDHGFDFDPRDPDTRHALERVEAFLEPRLRPLPEPRVATGGDAEPGSRAHLPAPGGPVAAGARPNLYQCPPCGASCDTLRFSGPGLCPLCGMTLEPERTASGADSLHRRLSRPELAAPR